MPVSATSAPTRNWRLSTPSASPCLAYLSYIMATRSVCDSCPTTGHKWKVPTSLATAHARRCNGAQTRTSDSLRATLLICICLSIQLPMRPTWLPRRKIPSRCSTRPASSSPCATQSPRWPIMLSSCPSILARGLRHPTPSSMPVQQATMWYLSCSTPRLRHLMPPSPST